MMLYFVILFLWVALLIYLLMGGADFGAGILELFFARKFKNQIRDNAYKAMGPIWEANHMWLIIAVVILFVGFPNVYTTVSVFLHIPILIMLLGIIARGTSFTFLHYDAVKDNWEKVYDKIFLYSSFITPFCLGVIAGSAVSGTIDTQSAAFSAAYIDDWLNWFQLSIGLFTVVIFGFLAAMYLSEGVKDQVLKQSCRHLSNVMILLILGSAGIVFFAAAVQSIPLTTWVFGNFVSLTAVVLAAISLLAIWIRINQGNFRFLRLLAPFSITALLIAVTYPHFPNIVILKNGRSLSLLDHDAPEKTTQLLGLALLFGGCLILPSLTYLVYSFQKKKASPGADLQAFAQRQPE